MKRGLVTEAEIDTALIRALFARARSARHVRRAQSPWNRIAPTRVGAPAHRALALEAARKAIVLLKNDAGRLPLARVAASP